MVVKPGKVSITMSSRSVSETNKRLATAEVLLNLRVDYSSSEEHLVDSAVKFAVARLLVDAVESLIIEILEACNLHVLRRNIGFEGLEEILVESGTQSPEFNELCTLYKTQGSWLQSLYSVCDVLEAEPQRLTPTGPKKVEQEIDVNTLLEALSAIQELTQRFRQTLVES